MLWPICSGSRVDEGFMKENPLAINGCLLRLSNGPCMVLGRPFSYQVLSMTHWFLSKFANCPFGGGRFTVF